MAVVKDLCPRARAKSAEDLGLDDKRDVESLDDIVCAEGYALDTGR